MTVYSFMKELLVEEGHFGNRNGAGGKTALQSSISNPQLRQQPARLCITLTKEVISCSFSERLWTAKEAWDSAQVPGAQCHQS